jgi:hypothetical protein
MELVNIYTGPLSNPNDMKCGPTKQAYVSWREQRTRCYNKKREKYKNYGAKGIDVKYTSREFIGWWLENIKTFKGNNPTISRIDHNKNYEFGNIRIESRSENSSERNNRVSSFHKPKKVLVIGTNGELIAIFKSRNEAGNFFSINSVQVSYCIKKCKSYKKFKFVDN